ncbi:hypothetical protein Acr_00g0078520 [Actinidia rufa]|uniref:Uncharacterized protein n=1 Tax=Actinidia rufa TaxID=165716 RepID=A0A7J0DUW5_9ERIC|nr:hypothetical protein Acr_00g0078520 [Actinidia rufa]
MLLLYMSLKLIKIDLAITGNVRLDQFPNLRPRQRLPDHLLLRPHLCSRVIPQSERRLEYGDRLRLGGLGVAELELEGCAGEEIRHAGLDDDDGAVAVRRDDSVFDWFVVFGAVVVVFEGGGAGLSFWRMRRRVFPGFERWVFGDWDGRV